MNGIKLDSERERGVALERPQWLGIGDYRRQTKRAVHLHSAKAAVL